MIWWGVCHSRIINWSAFFLSDRCSSYTWSTNFDTIEFIDIFLEPFVTAMLLNIFNQLLLSEQKFVYFTIELIFKLAVCSFGSVLNFVFGQALQILFIWIVIEYCLWHAFVKDSVISSASRQELPVFELLVLLVKLIQLFLLLEKILIKFLRFSRSFDFLFPESSSGFRVWFFENVLRSFFRPFIFKKLIKIFSGDSRLLFNFPELLGHYYMARSLWWILMIQSF